MQVSFCPFNQSIKLRRKRGDLFWIFKTTQDNNKRSPSREEEKSLKAFCFFFYFFFFHKQERRTSVYMYVCVCGTIYRSIDPKMWKQPKIKGWSFLTNRHIRHHFFFQLWSIFFFLTFWTKKSRSILLHNSTKCPEIVLIGTFYTSKTISFV